MKNKKTCCFFGHRKINNTEEVQNRLLTIIENLIISENVKTFLFGSRSKFDDLCHCVVTELKTKYPYICRICYLTKSETATREAEREKMEESYSKLFNREIHLKGYEEVILPEKMYLSGRASYVERNQLMIDQSDFCVVYFDENYLPPRRKNSKRDVLDYQPNSGTKIAFDYAIKHDKKIINIAD